METEKMKLLVVEPLKKPYVKEIDSGLASLQHEVGGYIQAVYPWAEMCAIVCDEEAKLTGKEIVLDAYCGTGTIGIIASKHAKEVYGVELNKDAIRDAVTNAKRNDIKNIRFVNEDAGKYMVSLAEKKESDET
jgi:tRNA/tmRNA/rRNA uracil-C5-methylase (TrmA/RlmC/RlmD family)